MLRSQNQTIQKHLASQVEDPLGLGVLKMQDHLLHELISGSPSRFKWEYTDRSDEHMEIDEDDQDEGLGDQD